jgi:PKD domain
VALISQVVPLDGPSSDIVALGGVAMASDGSGGVVYSKRVDGRAHIFVARYDQGQWSSPQRVDVGQPFESSFAAIGAGEGGRLVVVWVNHYSSTTDGLFSAALDPGSSGFQPPVPVDLNIGQATGTYPSVAMNLAGNALVAYRVITAVSGPSTPEIPAGYVLSDIRLARFDGQFWSSFGMPLERDPAQPVPAPTAAIAPKVAIDLTGQGLLAWQEPDDNRISRIYARRIFGMVPGNLLQVSSPSYAGHPLNGPVDDFALDVGGFGEGAVAYREQPAAGSGFSRPRLFVNEIPSSFDPRGSVFSGARVIDGAAPDGPTGSLGPLSVSVDGEGDFDAGFGAATESLQTRGDETHVDAPTRLDDGTSSVGGEPLLTRADNGALTAAWKVQIHGAGGVSVLERRADGTPNRQLVSAPRGGAVGALDLGGSHHGDAIVAFLQGDGANAQIAALSVRAPPGEFVVDAPSSWLGRRPVPLQWETPLAGAGALTYSVLVDDREVAGSIDATEYVLGGSAVSSGVHTVQIEATDSLGQVVDSEPATLKVDHTPPTVRIHARARAVTVSLRDGVRADSSGVQVSSVRVSFGDGQTAAQRKTLRHSYRHAGTYVLSVSALDRAGNRRSIKRRLHIR